MPVATGIQAPNAMEKLAQLSSIGGNLLQQRALSQQIGANVAASEAFRGAVDPATGRVDLDKAAASLAQDPRGAYNVPELMGQIQSQRSAQLENQIKQFTLAKDQIGGLKNRLGALMANPNAGPRDVMSEMANMVNQGLVTPEQAVEELRSMPQDPAQLNGWLRQHMVSVMDAEAQLAALSPQFEQVQQGSQTTLLNTNPLFGQGVGVAGQFEQGMTPGEASQPVTIVNPQTGAQEIITRGQFAGQRGAGGGLQTSLPVGQEDIIKGAAKRYDEAVAGLPELQNALQGLKSALDVLPGTITGPGAETAMSITGLLNTFGIPAAKDETTNFQELHKYLQNQLSTSLKANGNVKSDTGLNSFIGGQPNAETMNPPALTKAIKFVTAQTQGAVSRSLAMQDYVAQNGAASIPEFERKWSQAYNPNAMYMRTLENPEEKQEFWKSLSQKQQKNAKDSYLKMGALGAFSYAP